MELQLLRNSLLNDISKLVWIPCILRCPVLPTKVILALLINDNRNNHRLLIWVWSINTLSYRNRSAWLRHFLSNCHLFLCITHACLNIRWLGLFWSLKTGVALFKFLVVFLHLVEDLVQLLNDEVFSDIFEILGAYTTYVNGLVNILTLKIVLSKSTCDRRLVEWLILTSLKTLNTLSHKVIDIVMLCSLWLPQGIEYLWLVVLEILWLFSGHLGSYIWLSRENLATTSVKISCSLSLESLFCSLSHSFFLPGFFLEFLSYLFHYLFLESQDVNFWSLGRRRSQDDRLLWFDDWSSLNWSFDLWLLLFGFLNLNLLLWLRDLEFFLEHEFWRFRDNISQVAWLLIADLSLILAWLCRLLFLNKWPCAEIIIGFFPSKIPRFNFRRKKLLSFKLSLKLISFNLKYSNVFTELSIVKRTSKSFNYKVSCPIIAGNFRNLIS